MRGDPQILSRRLAAFVKSVPAKDLAEQIGCDIRTAENIRRGHWPLARHWMGLLAAFGRDITEAVFHPNAAAERLEREVAELERQLQRKQAALELVGAEARSFAARDQKARTRLQDRATRSVSPDGAPM